MAYGVHGSSINTASVRVTPLSPYLFILATDTLQHVLQKATEDGLLSPLCDWMARLWLSLYVDDAVVFVNLVKADVDLIMSIMLRFSDATGLCITLHKSTVAPIRCSQVNLGEVLQSFSGAQVQFSITYLGLPICLGRMCMVHLHQYLDHTATRLAGWQGRLINIGGLIELVKTVLGALPMYLHTTIKPPKKFYKDMDKLRKRFLWTGSQ
jgi:hypothetical protein